MEWVMNRFQIKKQIVGIWNVYPYSKICLKMKVWLIQRLQIGNWFDSYEYTVLEH